MALTATLGTALTVSTNPDPNTLTTKSPYVAAATRGPQPFSVSGAWTAQAQPALLPIGIRDGSGDKPIKVHFVPSSGAAVTYTIKIWMYNPVSNSWASPKTNGSISYTGEVIDYILNTGYDAIFLQLTTISAGTLSIYYDASTVIKG